MSTKSNKEDKTVLITEAKVNEDRKKFKRMKELQLRENLIHIWKQLSRKGRKRLMENEIVEEDELFNQTDKIMKNLMRKFKLKDTVLFEHRRSIPTNNVPIDSKKTINFLKKQFSQNASKKVVNSKRAKKFKKYQKMKVQKLRALKQGNVLRHKTTHQHQLNLIKQANFHSSIFKKKKTRFFADLIHKASNTLGKTEEHLNNTGISKIG